MQPSIKPAAWPRLHVVRPAEADEAIHEEKVKEQKSLYRAYVEGLPAIGCYCSNCVPGGTNPEAVALHLLLADQPREVQEVAITIWRDGWQGTLPGLVSISAKLV